MPGKRATKIDAMLRHLATGGDAQDFAGTKFENLALARTIQNRGLIAWDGEGNRFVLTPAGWSALTPRRFGLPSLAASAAIGAIGVAALAFLWVPSARWQNSAHGHAATTLAVQTQALAPASIPAEISGRNLASVPASAPQPAPAAPAAAGESTTAPAAPPQLTEIPQPVPEQASAEAAPTVVKQAAVKKPPRRSARPAEQRNSFANFFGNFGRAREASQTRARQSSQTRSGLGSWFHI